ncbi:filamentous hemagglutinin N-terminal domain-containing protein [Gloeocapsopsis dulcis]|uniref:Filamentous haemagglutinin FhaB/tRNA nuclease CdiA-like TPS domain-containing protein n=1 Tax=Gloeocapsopsis dulcis AAB1 = 1H9 TaxID=1433147 RepID=A0A6N8FNQ9_9CHRO|nr:filamentous hemagglutinin N-terminal domain-containing protein [Gloeocapsopsis dulcis]MUL35020.1 hypothetical protein [Gloeocapsopsis dulcis AAB1 = 1H9]WNN89905.1 filamentous hemagglutinin N-terminal domain-containing protein [Gloeocapsopsis dulcis]
MTNLKLGLSGLRLVQFTTVVGAIALSQTCAQAQITPDTTLGSENSVVTPDVIINGTSSDRIDGGAIRGANLFHSFQEFNIDAGRGAYFSNPAGIDNILSRVTGNNPSNILGTLGVLGNANLFLMNPNGIIFGENSSLNVAGSFIATTANAIGFGEQGLFNASSPNVPSSLLTVSPSAFLFNQINASSIENRSTAPAGQDAAGNSGYFGLRVPDGQSLLLIGGDITADGGGIVAFGGRVDLAAVAGIGTVGLEHNGDNFSLSVPDDLSRADVALTNGAGFIVAGEGGGDIAIAAQNINILEGSSLSAGILSDLGSDGAQAGDITLNAKETVNIAGSGRSLIENDVNQNATGNGGNIDIQAGGSIFLRDGAVLSTNISGEGNAGIMSLIANDSVFIEGIGDTRFNTLVLNRVEKGAAGNAGEIKITTGSLVINNNAQISSITEGEGNSGNVVIEAQDLVSLDNATIFSEVSDGEVAGSEGGIGSGGDIKITTSNLSLVNGSQLRSDTESLGNAGNVAIIATDKVTLSGRGPATGPFRDQIISSAISSTVEEKAIGEGGDITLKTNSLVMNDGAFLDTRTIGEGNAGDIFIEIENFVSHTAQLRARTQGRGNAGNIKIVAGDSVSFDDSPAGAFSSVDAGSLGDGGNIEISARAFSLSNGAVLSTSTSSTGKAGNIVVNATEQVTLDGAGSGLLATTQDSPIVREAGNNNDAGQLTNTSQDLTFGATGQLVPGIAGFLSSSNDVDFYKIYLNGNQTFSATTVGNTNVDTRLFLFDANGRGVYFNDDASDNTYQSTLPAGHPLTPAIAGEYHLAITSWANDPLSNDGKIFGSGSFTDILGSTGSGGALPLSDWNNRGADHGGYIISLTDISATPATIPSGNGGDIKITTGSLSITNGAQMQASTAGHGNAGNIDIQSRSLIVQDSARIAVNSEGSGNAGGLTLKSGQLLIQNAAEVSASTTSSGQGGNIDIQAGAVRLSDRAQINASSQGQGNAGSITINADGLIESTNSDILTFADQAAGGAIAISAQDIRLRGDSDIQTNVASGTGGGGNITLSANSILAFDDSDILAFAQDGRGGNIALNTSVFFGENFQPAAVNSDPSTLDGNNRVDINATGAVAGVVNIPDVSFIQNSLTELPANIINTETLVANSCIARSRNQAGNFLITGTGGLPSRPGEQAAFTYSTGSVRSIPDTSSSRTWQLGDRIVEPQGAYRLSNGQLILSRECS